MLHSLCCLSNIYSCFLADPWQFYAIRQMIVSQVGIIVFHYETVRAPDHKRDPNNAIYTLSGIQ